MDFAQFLKKQAQIIDTLLNAVLFETSVKVAKTSPDLRVLFEKFSESSEGGKRIRGALVLLGYQVAGGQNPEKIMDAALAFEVFQTAILAQDDVIDKSLVRRSKPSLYSSLGADHKAVSQTICLSDLGFFICFELLSGLKIEDSLKIKAINLFSQTLTQTVLGEMLDIEAPFQEGDFSEEDVLKISLLKTARYTISGPLMLGATLAGAEDSTLSMLKIFGDNLGIGFQIQDDILGIFGDEKVTGKSNSSDIKEGKATLLLAYVQKNGTVAQKKMLDEYYGRNDIDKKEVAEVKKVFIESRALEYANSSIKKYFDKALESLNGTKEELLSSLLEFLKDRTK